MTHLRSAAWATGAPTRWLLVGLLRVYRLTLAGVLGGQCRFYPSCSHYAEEAVRVHGAAKGSALAAWRVMRCAPWTSGGVDRVPPRRGKVMRYEGAIQRIAADGAA